MDGWGAAQSGAITGQARAMGIESVAEGMEIGGGAAAMSAVGDDAGRRGEACGGDMGHPSHPADPCDYDPVYGKTVVGGMEGGVDDAWNGGIDAYGETCAYGDEETSD